MHRLFRPTKTHQSDSPLRCHPILRTLSPLGCSILMTSAPKSPRIVAIVGAAKSVAASITFKPASGIGVLLAGSDIRPPNLETFKHFEPVERTSVHRIVDQATINLDGRHTSTLSLLERSNDSLGPLQLRVG